MPVRVDIEILLAIGKEGVRNFGHIQTFNSENGQFFRSFLHMKDGWVWMGKKIGHHTWTIPNVFRC